ncbi:hypothetical protein CF392_06455 [Tamilnaduibacter salinus]|uniref:Uncharacterized protein n=1 Tax=Tamilnaduibacter salinus TaxID=1484056 RepID=A0A2A2I3M3_9GAMM|nr:transporter substrate-binding domain-containing protein [Tamilnaduibacter salinus]PAV26319.1 hypothetical protein CF392_06455 [Tamilnaduibacter salinus]
MNILSLHSILAAIFLMLSIQAHADSVFMVSEEWASATNADGSGLYWDVMREVYEPEGYSLEIDVFPYARAVAMVKREDAAFWVGSYMDEHSDVLYPEPQNYFDADTVKAAIPAGKTKAITDQESLAGKTVGWVRGYAYDQYMDVAVNHKALNEIEQGLQMVASGRLDAVLDEAWELEQAMEKTDLSSDEITPLTVLNLPLYPAFQNTDRGKELRRVYNARFPELVESGRIQELYNKYDDYDQYRTGLAD